MQNADRAAEAFCILHSAFCISSMSNLPDWADDLRRRYLRGEASIFVLHGNVFDAVLSGDRFLTLTDFLGNALLKESKETIAVYNVATGVRFLKRGKDVENLDDLILQTEKTRVLGANLETSETTFQFGSFISSQRQRHMAQQRTSTTSVSTSH